MGLLSVQHWTPAELIANYVAALDRDTEDDLKRITSIEAEVGQIRAEIDKRAKLRAEHLALMATVEPSVPGPVEGSVDPFEPTFDEVVSTMSGRILQA